jgi:hypothetical protein
MLTGAKTNHTHQRAETESNMNGYGVLKTERRAFPLPKILDFAKQGGLPQKAV